MMYQKGYDIVVRNNHLHEARNAKSDEFYTELPQIAAELSHYVDKFQGKVVYCNCDDPFDSSFVKYFLMNFNRLGLKELIATGYKVNSVSKTSSFSSDFVYALRVIDTKSYFAAKQQEDMDDEDLIHFLSFENESLLTRIFGNAVYDNDGNFIRFYKAGDFRSDMSIELLKQSDIVVTNPPFSLFREYVAQLMEFNKQFLIIGSQNAITYKEFFPLIRSNKIWLGSQRGVISLYFRLPKTYSVPDSARRVCVSKFGEDYCNEHNLTYMRTACWFTNIDHANRHIMLPLSLEHTYYGHEDMYPKYDNYDAINVNRTDLIPSDFMGVMGVPISFLYKYCPEQFEIVAFRKGENAQSVVFTEEEEKRLDYLYPSLTSIPGMIKNAEGAVDGKNMYARILIRRKR